jgi:5'-3' exonuclease
MKKVILLDSKNVLYRMHFSHMALQTRDGFPTGAMFGFWKEILRLAKTWPGASMVFCWDGRGKTWRHKLGNTGYKANRKQTVETENVHKQEEVLKPLLEAMGFWTPEVEGVEGDDLLGVISGGWKGEKEIRVYSGDKDMFQLVGKGVTVWQSWKEKPMGVQEVKSRMGMEPRNLTEIRAMAGDSADNLRGLWKVGIKNAVKLYHLGVRPSQTWKEMVPEAQEATTKWKKDWPRVQREYQLALIPRSPEAPCWTEEQKEKLEKLVQDISTSPERRERSRQERRGAWLEFLGRYELADLWARKERVWKIP